MNARMAGWLGLADDTCDLNLHDLLPRPVRIYYETHLRPLLLVEGALDEVSVDFLRGDGTRFGTYMNASADIIDGQVERIRMAVFRHDARKSFEEELIARRRESDVFKVLVASSPQAVISVDDGMIVRTWNTAATNLFGYAADTLIGEPVGSVLLSTDTRGTFATSLARAMTGEVVREETVRIHRDGHPIAVEASMAAVHDELGQVFGVVMTYTNISQRKTAEAEARNLLLELNHRAKNVLSIVQVIARQTGRLHDGPDFHAMLSQRLASLISNQESLVHKDGRNADLAQLVRAQFSHLVDPLAPTLTFNGPDLLLSREASQAIGMAIFELVTNAVKYGALSQPAGRVSLLWTVSDGLESDTRHGLAGRGRTGRHGAQTSGLWIPSHGADPRERNRRPNYTRVR
ncbi:sensor histidine kinase [Loktanella sp. M215]|uniref:sensor histidine kinase n=1 Tax=Loktanella sp. M215 TaxID=2675431 RepID=UPI001F34E596|nr:PAS domain S-box protein [Loktanella sp. M215]MCF7701640.1 PAS domain S-box protein [Loktanella sp. M215]